MKLVVIFGVCLCMQRISASARNDDCPDKLKALQEELGKFFKNFDKEHKIAKDWVDKIQKKCQTLSNDLNRLTAKLNTCNEEEVECLVAEFLESFFNIHIDITEHLAPSFERQVNLLLSMVDDLKSKTKWNCTDGKACTCSCEAKLNEIICELDASFDILETAGAVVLGYVARLLEFCNELNELAEKFDCTYHPICNESNESGEKDRSRSEKDESDEYDGKDNSREKKGKRDNSREKDKSCEKGVSNESDEEDQCCESVGSNFDWLAVVKAFVMRFDLDEPAGILTNISEICDRTDEGIHDWLHRLKF
ncbi:uncharacterized protein LOC119082626 [Bradysia coprophila]|uniref:uncharacterized protein LOC119082626 n=1 Tax=Bradysia coprophila TaxID=38358 RepID=UPI00187DC9BB|nr:uncharacterized protein LOC119082626 [Bradysia coprophila]